MFHTYDNQLVFTNVTHFDTILHNIEWFFQKWFCFITNDFYFLGSIVLLISLFCMFQMFYSIVDIILNDKDHIDTKIILMKKRILNLETTLDSCKEEIAELKNINSLFKKIVKATNLKNK
jgi:hypothetical protein